MSLSFLCVLSPSWDYIVYLYIFLYVLIDHAHAQCLETLIRVGATLRNKTWKIGQRTGSARNSLNDNTVEISVLMHVPPSQKQFKGQFCILWSGGLFSIHCLLWCPNSGYVYVRMNESTKKPHHSHHIFLMSTYCFFCLFTCLIIFQSQSIVSQVRVTVRYNFYSSCKRLKWPLKMVH